MKQAVRVKTKFSVFAYFDESVSVLNFSELQFHLSFQIKFSMHELKWSQFFNSKSCE